MLDKEDLQAIAQLMDTRFATQNQRLDAKFAAIDARFAAIDARFDAQDKRFEDRFAAIDARFDAQDKRFDAQDKRFDAQDKRFDAQDKRFDRIEARLDSLEELATRTALTQENIVLPAINALVEGQEMTHQMIKQLATKEEVQDIRDQLQVLKTVVASHSRDIEQLKKAQ